MLLEAVGEDPAGSQPESGSDCPPRKTGSDLVKFNSNIINLYIKVNFIDIDTLF